MIKHSRSVLCRDQMKYDVFLCYNSKNKSDPRVLYQSLCRSNFNVFFDETEVLPGYDFQTRVKSGFRGSASVIVLVGPGGLGPWQEFENRGFQTISVKTDRPIIPVLLPETEETFQSDQTPACHQFKSQVAFESALDGSGFVRQAAACPRAVAGSAGFIGRAFGPTNPTLKRIFRSPLVGSVASLLPILAKRDAKI
jgi:hypothetical protein